MSTERFTDEGEPARSGAWYYDVATGAVERGPVRSWESRMGPYDTREEAERALETARARSEAWDEEDRREREE